MDWFKTLRLHIGTFKYLTRNRTSKGLNPFLVKKFPEIFVSGFFLLPSYPYICTIY